MKIRPPEWLSLSARKEFTRVATALDDKVREVDLSLLADYAQAYAECIELQERIYGWGDHKGPREGEGLTLIGPKGGEYLNPVYVALMARRGELAAMRRDLFFTPKSRNEKKSTSQAKGKTILDKLNEEDEN